MTDSISTDPTTADTIANEAPIQCKATHPSSPEPVRDDVFYYEVVHIQARGSLSLLRSKGVSRCTRHGLRSNVPRRDTISVSVWTGGTHSKNPIVLEGVDVDSFRSFLKIAWKRLAFYVNLIATDPANHYANDTPSREWRGVLQLARLWNFEQIRAEKEVYKAACNDAFDMLELGQEFRVKAWVIRGYTVLVDPAFCFSGKALVKEGLEHRLTDLLLIRESLRLYTQQPPEIGSQQKAHSQAYECFSCHERPPSCLRGNYWDGHSERCPGLGFINWCGCRETLFVHPGASLSFDDMAQELIKEVFKEELEAF
ncbi:hypothetical protein BJ165DRAFT_1410543 [Panaeolus papilionaceus]|nr:hypothetical protein BJ165DRAFT_1410543 [Panaeolus papilionaceus]